MRVRNGAVLVALAGLGGCFSLSPEGGLYSCDRGCPGDYVCHSDDNRCWPPGSEGGEDAGVGGSAQAPSDSTSSVAAQPASLTANGSSTATITVTMRDLEGNALKDRQVWLSVSGTGNTLTQPGALTDAQGVTTGKLASSVAEDKIIRAALGSVDSIVKVETKMTFTPVMPVNLLFTAPPSNAGPGGILSPAVVVTAVDDTGTAITGPGVTITVTLNDAVPATGAKLSGSTSVATTDGVAKFTTLSVDKVGRGFTLTASAGALSANSSPFDISASLPSPPTNVMATTSNASTITLSWTGQAGVTHYNVLRAGATGGPYTQVAQPTAASYVDPNLQHGNYFYVVQAVSSFGIGGASAEVNAAAHQELCVANYSANAGAGSVTAISADSLDLALGPVRSFTVGLKGPFGLAVAGPAALMFVANNTASNVAIYPRIEDALTDNAMPVLVSGPASAPLNAPTGIAYDAVHDEVIVVNSGNKSVVGFPLGGGGAASWSIVGPPTMLSVPEGVAVDGANGEVYVSNFGNNKILTFRRLDCATIGSNCFPFRTFSNNNGSINGPVALYFDSGTLFVANSSANNVAAFDDAHAIAPGATSPLATRIVTSSSFGSVSGVIANATKMFVSNDKSVIILPRAASGDVTGTAITAGGVLNGATGIAFCN